ncbi:MAG: hypothetical protein II087_07235, partial [Muribaculaceae bacterium]|nr:hypothetical protein [Muribaculaceae bacterium]
MGTSSNRLGGLLLCLFGCFDLLLCGADEVIGLDGLGLVVDDDNADVGELGAGGLDGLAVLTLGHNGVGVAVDHNVDALD